MTTTTPVPTGTGVVVLTQRGGQNVRFNCVATFRLIPGHTRRVHPVSRATHAGPAVIRYRYPFDGPEPPATVRELAIGPGGWGPMPYPGGTRWNRTTTRYLRRNGTMAPVDIGRRRLWHLAYLRRDVGNVWRRVRCPRRPCAGAQCWHWFNGDRSRPWALLPNRAVWPHAHDTVAQGRLHRHHHH